MFIELLFFQQTPITFDLCSQSSNLFSSEQTSPSPSMASQQNLHLEFSQVKGPNFLHPLTSTISRNKPEAAPPTKLFHTLRLNFSEAAAQISQHVYWLLAPRFCYNHMNVMRGLPMLEKQ
ncbi:hypothetical protein CHARACLAT_028144 [Characodon lateralis]|uniref:Uncharacterized protein n=1 Tax=Characodon lateralis TaxID=208331 RepID=A0ABU7ER78_9TELE|nr:hypothetical protein [Characodon lateralis]